MPSKYTILRDEKSGAVSDAIYASAIRSHYIEPKVIGIRDSVTEYEKRETKQLSEYDFYGKVRVRK